MSSYFNLDGGFFFVLRYNSVVIFLSNFTSTSAEKIVSVTFVSRISSSSAVLTGGSGVGTLCGVVIPKRERDEKKPERLVGCGTTGFDVPVEYTQRMTSAFMGIAASSN
jgi:hypothetical protein